MSRSVLLLAVAAGLVVGCGGATQPCRPGTAFVTATFTGAALEADAVDLTITVDQKSLGTTRDHTPGATTETFEITFASYPAGSTFALELKATRQGTLVGTGLVGGVLKAGCTPLALGIVPVASSDASVDDLSAAVDGAVADLAVATDADPPGDLGALDDLVAVVDLTPIPDSCSINTGLSCGSCGGVYDCANVCTVATPGNYGAGCGSCGGTIDCAGGCTVATPGNYDADCGSCGGKINCAGACSVSTPGNYDADCGSCGGKINCAGACSVSTPGNYNADCGSCGGKINCAGACSVSTPVNYNADCGSCNGKITCAGTCSISTPAAYGNGCECGQINCSNVCSGSACNHTTQGCSTTFACENCTGCSVAGCSGPHCASGGAACTYDSCVPVSAGFAAAPTCAPGCGGNCTYALLMPACPAGTTPSGCVVGNDAGHCSGCCGGSCSNSVVSLSGPPSAPVCTVNVVVGSCSTSTVTAELFCTH